MKNLYNWIIIIIFVIIFGQCVILQKRYDVLQQNYDELLFEKSSIIDSLEFDNIDKKESINSLEAELQTLNDTIDSLSNIKLEIKSNKNNFTISNSITESSNILKQNLNEKMITFNSTD